MYRMAMEKLYEWKDGKHRKPLIIEGARQVGKTWLMEEFGRKAYVDTMYINFDANSRMAELFDSDLNTDRLIMGMELYAGRKIDPGKTLLIFDEVQEAPRAKEYEAAIMWLCDCGLVHKVSRVNAGEMPLKAYEDLKAFKLFMVDVGLLGCMTGLSQRILLDGNDLFVEFKGALTEQYVCQQLKSIEDMGVYYYTNDRGSCEVDFIVDTGERIVPLEVKAEVNLKAKSLKTYREKYSPEISVRTSMADYKREDGLVNLPLYAVGEIWELL